MDSHTLARPEGRRRRHACAATVAVAAGSLALGPALAVACSVVDGPDPVRRRPADPASSRSGRRGCQPRLAGRLAVWRGVSARVLALAISLGLSVSAPTIGGLVHGSSDTSFIPAAMGLAVAAAAAAAAAVPMRVIRPGPCWSY